MDSGDSLTNYAYYCFHKIKLLPHEFDALPIREKAMIRAFIQTRSEAEKEEAAKMKKASKKR